MAGSVNKVILIGNLGRDPEIRHTNDRRPIANLSIALQSNGETAVVVNVGRPNGTASWYLTKNLRSRSKYLQKGPQSTGILQTRKWTDQQGVEKYTTEVVLHGSVGK